MRLNKISTALLVVGLALIGGVLITGVRERQIDAGPVISADVPVGTAKLSLIPTETTVRVGEDFKVTVKVDTSGSSSSGIDLVMSVDPTVAEVVDTDPAAEGVQITPGNLFPLVPYNQTNLAAGKIEFSTSQDPTGTPVTTASGEVATITFRAKAAGQTSLQFAFTAGQTNDTNVSQAGDGRDLLSGVGTATVTVTE